MNPTTFSENKVTKKSYIFVRKQREEMENIFSQGSETANTIDILSPQDEVHILKTFEHFDPILVKDIRDY